MRKAVFVRLAIIVASAATTAMQFSGCSPDQRMATDSVALGVLPELVMAVQQPPPEPAAQVQTANFGSVMLNPPRSTFKFNGAPESMETTIKTLNPVSFNITEEFPGDDGDDNKRANFNVVFGRTPGVLSEAIGVLHQSDPYFIVQSGWAYFAGSTALGGTTRIRVTPDSTEYFIQVFNKEVGNQVITVHRVVNVSGLHAEKLGVTCPLHPDVAPKIVLPCYFVEYDNDDCRPSREGAVHEDAEVLKFLESVNYVHSCPLAPEK